MVKPRNSKKIITQTTQQPFSAETILIIRGRMIMDESEAEAAIANFTPKENYRDFLRWKMRIGKYAGIPSAAGSESGKKSGTIRQMMELL